MKQESLDRFINEILDQKKLSGLTDEVRAQLVADMEERLIDQVDRALINALPYDRIDGLNNLIDLGADEASIQEYISQSGIDVSGIAAKTMFSFRELYLEAPIQ